jgi:hypothetical protein
MAIGLPDDVAAADDDDFGAFERTLALSSIFITP